MRHLVSSPFETPCLADHIPTLSRHEKYVTSFHQPHFPQQQAVHSLPPLPFKQAVHSLSHQHPRGLHERKPQANYAIPHTGIARSLVFRPPLRQHLWSHFSVEKLCQNIFESFIVNKCSLTSKYTQLTDTKVHLLSYIFCRIGLDHQVFLGTYLGRVASRVFVVPITKGYYRPQVQVTSTVDYEGILHSFPLTHHIYVGDQSLKRRRSLIQIRDLNW